MKREDDRGLYSPRTDKDWFLYDLFTDSDFIEIKQHFLESVKAVDPLGIMKLTGKPMVKSEEEIVAHYVKLLGAELDIHEEVARKGLLLHNEYSQAWSRNRAPVAYIENNRINIVIGSETRRKDVIVIWDHIEKLQEQLQGSKRSATSKDTTLAFAIYKQKLRNPKKKLSEIYDDYQHERLEGYNGERHYTEYKDFIDYYHRVVKGIKKTL
ncbi:MAG TPA: hypothetical protein VFH06_03035 [Candidatus Saccharimonadales bacterium]|nr:hypothetical protein [Candidatus Saccharimonadales bacterium]